MFNTLYVSQIYIHTRLYIVHVRRYIYEYIPRIIFWNPLEHRAVARLSTVGGQKGGAIENVLILEKFAKILENFEQNFLNNFWMKF